MRKPPKALRRQCSDWAAAPGPEGAFYRVEVRDAETATGAVYATETTLSAAPFEVPDDLAAHVWRVIQMTDADYASSPWQTPAGESVEIADDRRVVFAFAEGDRRARGYAERIGVAFQRAGTVVTYAASAEPLDTSRASYRFEADETLAFQVADFLPVLDAAPVRSSDADSAPGIVRVELVFTAEES